MSGLKISMADPQRVILEEIADKRFKQKSVALTYAFCIRQDGDTDAIDWRKINRAIIDRWSRSGLDRVKKRAWGLVEGRIQPCPASPDTFPVHPHHRPILRSIPWAVIEPHRRQAMSNHSQSLETLASRGGLDLTELAAVLEDRPWRRMTTNNALAVVMSYSAGSSDA